MYKILNWTFGACFRTLGRFLAIFIVGLLLVFIGSKIGIEMPSWLALNVKADTYGYTYDWANSLPSLTRLDYKSCNSTSCATNLDTELNTFESGFGTRDFITNATSMTIGTNGYIMTSPTNILKKNYLYSVDYYVCTNRYLRNFDWEIYASDYNTSITNYNTYQSYNLSNVLPTPGTGNDGKSWDYCYRFSSLIVPNSDKSWTAFRIRNNTGTNVTNAYISVISVDMSELGIYTSAIEDTIQNSGFATSESVEQVQQSVNKVEEEIKETQDTITDGDITGAEDSASGFFNDFSTDTFGLTSIITAPLNSINNLINSSCSSLVLPLPFVEKNLTLPCMTSIYSNYFKGFFDLYQIITTGLISYYVIVRIFNLVKDFKNPEHDEIEVMDL